jgi:L-alanine-DL-glutamate epimerase-like enolase superfamily enzyme
MAEARITDVKVMVVQDQGAPPWNLIRVETDRGVRVPDGPGLGIELNAEVAKAHLAAGERYWE